MLYSKNGSYPAAIPFRIRLSDGRTRTNPSTFTAEEISDAGYVEVSSPPFVSGIEVLQWSGSEWIVRDKTPEEIQAETDALWASVREERDRKINAVTWRYERYARHNRLNLPQIDNIANLDTYVQALADIPQTQANPQNIVWPVLEETI